MEKVFKFKKVGRTIVTVVTVKKLLASGIIACSILLVACGSKEETLKEENVTPKEETIAIPWQDQVKEIAASDKTETEKNDAITMLASGYQPKDDEIAQFEDHIVNEYKSGKYLSVLPMLSIR